MRVVFSAQKFKVQNLSSILNNIDLANISSDSLFLFTKRLDQIEKLKLIRKS